jgi:hypothetical protein
MLSLFFMQFSAWHVGWRFDFDAKSREDPLKYFFFVLSFLGVCTGYMSRDVYEHEPPSGRIFPSVVTQNHLLTNFWHFPQSQNLSGIDADFSGSRNWKWIHIL